MAQEQQQGTKEERLKAALWYNVGLMIDTIAIDEKFNTTPQFIAGLCELVWAHIENITKDTEAFAKHAGRETIRVEDVLMLARRNADLHQLLRKSADKVAQTDDTRR